MTLPISSSDDVEVQAILRGARLESGEPDPDARLAALLATLRTDADESAIQAALETLVRDEDPD